MVPDSGQLDFFYSIYRSAFLVSTYQDCTKLEKGIGCLVHTSVFDGISNLLLFPCCRDGKTHNCILDGIAQHHRYSVAFANANGLQSSCQRIAFAIKSVVRQSLILMFCDYSFEEESVQKRSQGIGLKKRRDERLSISVSINNGCEMLWNSLLEERRLQYRAPIIRATLPLAIAVCSFPSDKFRHDSE